jgi:hypothetical protein
MVNKLAIIGVMSVTLVAMLGFYGYYFVPEEIELANQIPEGVTYYYDQHVIDYYLQKPTIIHPQQ